MILRNTISTFIIFLLLSTACIAQKAKAKKDSIVGPYLSGVFNTKQDFWTHMLSDTGKVVRLGDKNHKKMVYPDGEKHMWKDDMPDIYGFQTSWGEIFELAGKQRNPIAVLLKGPISYYCRGCLAYIEGNCEPLDPAVPNKNLVCDFKERRPHYSTNSDKSTGGESYFTLKKGLEGDLVVFINKKGLLPLLEDDPTVYTWYDEAKKIVDPSLFDPENKKRLVGLNAEIKTLYSNFVAILWYNIRNSEGYEGYQLYPDASTFDKDITIEELINFLAD